MISAFELVKKLYSEGRYTEALSYLEESEDAGGVHPGVLVWKARCILLADKPTGYNLSDVEGMLQRALSADDEYLPAIIDLAYFYLNVLDNAERGRLLFTKALELCAETATEAVVGAAQCIAELESTDAALNFLTNAEAQLLNPDQIELARKDILNTNT